MTRLGVRRNIAVAIALGVLTIALGVALSIGHLGVLPARNLRKLAENTLVNAYNPWNQTLTSYSLNAVSAVVWDYRGIDTVLETAVLLTAITGVSALFRGVREVKSGSRGMSLMVKAPTRIIIVITAVISLSLAVHGHLTPGGGFQAGSIIATAVALGITAFSIENLYSIGLTTKSLPKVRLIALMLILSTALLPLAISMAVGATAYIMQNQVKMDSQFSMPSSLLNTPLAGSVFLFNIFEFIAVAAAFSYVLILFAMRKEELRLVLELERGK